MTSLRNDFFLIGPSLVILGIAHSTENVLAGDQVIGVIIWHVGIRVDSYNKPAFYSLKIRVSQQIFLLIHCL